MQTNHIDSQQAERAPDGSEVWPLLRLPNCSVAVFKLAGGQTTRAVRHRNVTECWYVVDGLGELWRSHPQAGSVVTPLTRGTAVEILPGCAFQFRATQGRWLEIVATTIPAWPGETEAEMVHGEWTSETEEE